jgi:uncharacterized membrane protein HdeD (DUF308 family)
MLNLLFRKWWIVLLQGILLIFLSLYIFRNPAEVLAGVSLWIGLLICLSGLMGIFSALGPDGSEHRGLLIVWSLLTAIFGFLLLTNMLATMTFLAILFGIWMLAGGIRLSVAGWSLKDTHTFGWIVTIAGIFSAVAGIMVIFDIGAGAVGISILLGVQVLVAGIALIVLSLVKKTIGSAVRGKVEELRNT